MRTILALALRVAAATLAAVVVACSLAWVGYALDTGRDGGELVGGPDRLANTQGESR